MAVVEHDARDHAAAGVAGGAQADDRVSVGQGLGHVHEVVLSADAADHGAVFESVRDRGARQGHHHGGVDEARVPTVQPVELFVAIELVGASHAPHADLLALGLRQGRQRVVERAGSQEEAAVDHSAVGQSASQARLFDAHPGGLMAEVGRDALAIGQDQHAVLEGTGRVEDAEVHQPGHVSSSQAR